MLKLTSVMSLPSHTHRFVIVHTAEQLPFGPFAGGIPGSACSVRELELLEKVDGIWAVSRKIQEYASIHGGLKTTFLLHHPWNYLIGDQHVLPRRRHNWGTHTVLMVNPCPVKGSDILIGVARQCPEVKFLALSSWGLEIHPKVAKDLEGLPNLAYVSKPRSGLIRG
jgi:hypothetical protein